MFLACMGFITRSQQAKARQGKLVLCELARVGRVRVREGLLTGAARDIKAGQQWLTESRTVRQWWG